MSVGKFWPDLEIPEALMVREVLFSGDFCVSESQFFFCRWISDSRICHFFLLFDLQELNFSEFIGTAYRTELVD